MSLCDEYGNIVIFDKTDSVHKVEAYALSLTIEMGGCAALVMPVISDRDMKRTLIRNMLTLAKNMSDAVLKARANSSDSSEEVAALENGRVLFRSKPASKQLKSEIALAAVGPSAFGYSVDFEAMPRDLL